MIFSDDKFEVVSPLHAVECVQRLAAETDPDLPETGGIRLGRRGSTPPGSKPILGNVDLNAIHLRTRSQPASVRLLAKPQSRETGCRISVRLGLPPFVRLLMLIWMAMAAGITGLAYRTSPMKAVAPGFILLLGAFFWSAVCWKARSEARVLEEFLLHAAQGRKLDTDKMRS